MAADMSVLGLILSSYPYLRSSCDSTAVYNIFLVICFYIEAIYLFRSLFIFCVLGFVQKYWFTTAYKVHDFSGYQMYLDIQVTSIRL